MAAEYLLDVLGDKPVLALPTHRRDAAADDAQARAGLTGGGAAGAQSGRHEASTNVSGKCGIIQSGRPKYKSQV